MKLAKDCLDIGLTTDTQETLAFLADDVGLGPPEILPVTRKVTQHRFDVEGSVVKANLVSELPTERRSGYTGVRIARDDVGEPRRLVGPGGLEVVLVPRGHEGVDQLGICLAVPSVTSASAYFRDALDWDVSGGTVRLGRSVVVLDESANAPAAVEMPVRGWTYMTVQIWDCDAETEAAVNAGAVLAQPAITLGKVARFSMIADPFGNQLELSQRASLTGPLPGNAGS